MLPITNPEYENLIKVLGPVIIGIVAALVGWIVNQLVIKRWESFRSENKAIALERLEKAYQPLYYLSGKLLLEISNKEDISVTKKQMSEILEKYGYLLNAEAQNMTIASLFMKDPNLDIIKTDRRNLEREIETLKTLIYSNYKLYENYYTTHFLGKIKVFWQALQYKIFSMFLVVGILFLIGYIAFRNLTVLVIILVMYLLIGSCFYLIKDYKKAKLLKKLPMRSQGKKESETCKVKRRNGDEASMHENS